jgi:hypothetical protein
MTSPRPESVTCLACREHAHREYLRLAEQIERLRGPGMPITDDEATKATAWLRDFATRFAN